MALKGLRAFREAYTKPLVLEELTKAAKEGRKITIEFISDFEVPPSTPSHTVRDRKNTR